MARRWGPLILESIESGESSECGGCEVLRGRTGNRGMLMRVRDSSGDSVIVKAWHLRDLKERLQGLSGLSMARREWRAHRHLERAGLRVPRLLEFLRLRCRDGRRFEAIVAEDLGETVNGMVHLKDLLQVQDEAAVQEFEDRVIEITRQLLDAGIVDVDHQLRNIVVGGANEPMRIDFECARRYRGLAPPTLEYGRMLGRLVVSHAYACQPEVGRTEAFARRLAERLEAPAGVLSGAKGQIDRALAHQNRVAGIESRLALGW